MSEYIIITRNPIGLITPIVDSSLDNVYPPFAVFATERIAEDFAINNQLCHAWGYQIVEVEL